ncbi:MAG: polysaccharide deacetylase family protein [Sulfuriferula sp.]
MQKTSWKPGRLIYLTLAIHATAVLVLLTTPQHWRWVLASLIANHLVLALVGLWPRSSWLGKNWTQLPDAAIARNEIALTIDDGPDPEVTPQVLDILARYGVHATFFCIGDVAQRYPALCRDIISRGHAIENHSQQHRYYFSLLGIKGLTREIQSAQTTLTAITGQPPLFFRAPAGLRNPFLDPVLYKLGLQLATWSVRAFDTRVGDADKVARTLVHGLRAGAIILLHDAHAARTATGEPVILKALPKVIDAALAAKLHFVTLRQALL